MIKLLVNNLMQRYEKKMITAKTLRISFAIRKISVPLSSVFRLHISKAKNIELTREFQVFCQVITRCRK